MSQIETSYQDLKQKIISEFDKNQFVALATSEGDYVTVRTMQFVTKGLKIFFITNPNYKKYKQIVANPNVAIAAPWLQIEGSASLKGHPIQEKNTEYFEAYEEKNPESFERSKRVVFTRKDLAVIEVTPKKITLYNSANAETGEEPYLEILNTVTKKAYKVPRSAASDSSAYNV
jgi:uncharacterized pyridoxamine 5'-phosphate oxidase family protein